MCDLKGKKRQNTWESQTAPSRYLGPGEWKGNGLGQPTGKTNHANAEGSPKKC